MSDRKWLVLAAVSLGMFMALLDATIVNIAVPAIMTDLNTGVTRVSWVLNAYNLGLAALFLSAGRLADRLGQKRIFIGGLVLFTLFSLACGLAPNIEWLIVFRVGQAIGGAAMAPVSLSILLGVFPQRQHGMAVGLWGALGAVAAALGPSLGGVIVQYAHWHWIFFINVPIGAIALGMALWVVPERKSRRGRGRPRPAGGAALQRRPLLPHPRPHPGQSWGWSSGRVIGLLVAARGLLPAVSGMGVPHPQPHVRPAAHAHPLLHRRQHRHALHRHVHGRRRLSAGHFPGGRARL